MDFRHLIVTCLFSMLRLPFDNQKVKENYAIFSDKSAGFEVYQQLVRRVPTSGTAATKDWYSMYLRLVRQVPLLGTRHTKGQYQPGTYILLIISAMILIYIPVSEAPPSMLQAHSAPMLPFHPHPDKHEPVQGTKCAPSDGK